MASKKNNQDENDPQKQVALDLIKRGIDYVPTEIPTIAQLIAEGEELLRKEDEEKSLKIKKSNKENKEKIKDSPKHNPYEEAREIILSSYGERRKQIEDMEKNNDITNHIYKDFMKAVIKCGDKLSDSGGSTYLKE